MDLGRIKCEAILINKLFAARKMQNVYVLDGGTGLPRFMATPSTIVYAMNVPPSLDGTKFAAMQDDLAAYVAEFYETNDIVILDESGHETAPAVRVDRFWKRIEIQRPDPEHLLYDQVEWGRQHGTALLGCRYTGKGVAPVTWTLDADERVNALVAGTTGSGKTNELMSILISAAQSTPSNELQFVVLDPKRSDDIAMLKHLPHCGVVAREYDEIMLVLQNIYHEMEERERGNRPKTVRMVLVLEEAASLLNNHNKQLRDEATFLLEDLGRRCRESRINLIVCTQSPTVEVIGRVKDILPQRIVGSVVGKNQALTAVDVPQSGADALPGRGAFIHRIGKTLTRFQAPLVNRPMGLIRAVNDSETAPYTVRTWTEGGAARPAAATKPPRVQEDAAKIKSLWQQGATMAAMLREVSGNPAIHTGSNFWRSRVTAALAWLEENEQKPDDTKIIRLRKASGGD